MSRIRCLDVDRSALLVVMVVFASIIINLFIKGGYDFEYLILSTENMLLEDTYISSLIYVLITRIKQLFIIILCIKVFGSNMIKNSISIIICFLFGMLSTVQSYYFGFVGIIEIIIYMFPHYLIYYILIGEMCKIGKSHAGNKIPIGKKCLIFILFLVGIVFEGIFSRFFLEKFYQYIVSRL